MDFETQSIIIDSGSLNYKCGFSGENEPSIILPSVVGRPTDIDCLLGFGGRDRYVGEQALDMISMSVEMHHIYERGEIRNWDDFEALLHFLYFVKLKIEPENVPLFYLLNPLIQIADKEKVCQIVFETFNQPALFIDSSTIYPLYALGKSTGISIDSGDGITTVSVVKDGISNLNYAHKNNFAGVDVTNELSKSFVEKGFNFQKQEHHLVRRIKENYCYVAEDYDVELLNLKKEKIENKRVKLPDGTELYLDESSFKSTEILFQPYYNDKKSIIDTFMKTYDSIGDQNLKSTVLDSIVLSGGNTKLPGFSKRFQKEIEKATGENVNIHSTENPLNSNWLAASMMTMQTNTMNSKWITMDQYDENGPCISHSGCYERNII